MWNALGLGLLGGAASHVGTKLAEQVGGFFRSDSSDEAHGCVGGDCGCDECEITSTLRDLGPEIGGYHAIVGGYAEEAIYARRDKRVLKCRKDYDKEVGLIPAYVGSDRIERARAKRDECILAAHRDAEKELSEYRASIEASKAEDRIKAAERVAEEAKAMADKARRRGANLVSRNILRASRTVSAAAAAPPASPEAPATNSLLEAVRLLTSLREVFGPATPSTVQNAPAGPVAPPEADPVLLVVGDPNAFNFTSEDLNSLAGENACATGRCG